MVGRLRACGVSVEVGSAAGGPEALGRRRLAELLVQQKKAARLGARTLSDEDFARLRRRKESSR